MTNLIALAVALLVIAGVMIWMEYSLQADRQRKEIAQSQAYWHRKWKAQGVTCIACHEESQGTYCTDGEPLSPCPAHRKACCVECGCLTDKPYSSTHEVVCTSCETHIAYAEELQAEYLATYSPYRVE